MFIGGCTMPASELLTQADLILLSVLAGAVGWSGLEILGRR